MLETNAFMDGNVQINLGFAGYKNELYLCASQLLIHCDQPDSDAIWRYVAVSTLAKAPSH